MQIGVEGIENLIVIIVSKGKTLEKHKFEENIFPFFHYLGID
jgi:hypothetical protein